MDCVADPTDTETQITSLTMAGMLMSEVLDEALTIPAVVGQNEQLNCHHQYMNAGTLQGDAMKKCLKCGDYVKAL